MYKLLVFYRDEVVFFLSALLTLSQIIDWLDFIRSPQIDHDSETDRKLVLRRE